MSENTETIILGQGVELSHLLLVLVKNKGIVFSEAFDFVIEQEKSSEHNKRIKLDINHSERKMFLHFPMVFQVKESNEVVGDSLFMNKEEALSMLVEKATYLFDNHVSKHELESYMKENFETIFSVDSEY